MSAVKDALIGAEKAVHHARSLNLRGKHLEAAAVEHFVQNYDSPIARSIAPYFVRQALTKKPPTNYV